MLACKQFTCILHGNSHSDSFTYKLRYSQNTDILHAHTHSFLAY